MLKDSLEAMLGEIRLASVRGRPEEFVQTPGIQHLIQPRIQLLKGSAGDPRQNLRRHGTKTLP
jgi:hypothetical protein